MAYSDQLRRMNEHNREFWAREIPQLPARMSAETNREITMIMLNDEQTRLPVYYQNSLNELSRKAEQFNKIALAHLAKKAGRNKKPDNLQLVIRDIVGRHPHVTETALRGLLNRDKYPDLITDVDEDYIYFKTNRDTERPAKISGLKDRLSRAKRAQTSR
jgi:hypothetical protein